ncbi:MAG: hypothetical protein U0800_15520 [Isosphaeraceae bacterium]
MARTLDAPRIGAAEALAFAREVVRIEAEAARTEVAATAWTARSPGPPWKSSIPTAA